MKTLASSLVAASLFLPSISSAAEVKSSWDVRWMDQRDKEVPAKLAFNVEQKAIVVTPSKNGASIEVPFTSIDKISYEASKHHRVKSGAIVMLASVGVGAIVMATKSTNHWLYVDYKASDGAAKDLVLRLDKSDYENILDAAQRGTGKSVETIHAARKGRD